MAIFDFLSLPGELRNSIYGFTLTTDPPEPDREHKYNCHWCTWNTTSPQHPTKDALGRRLPGCRCWARGGLDLLLANRQVNEEASSIFWAENHFTFQDPQSFLALVGERLRPRYQQMIQNITVFPGRYGETVNSRDRFWIILFRCKSLRHLEIPQNLRLLHLPWTPEQDDAEAAAWDYLKSMLPNLKTFARVYQALAGPLTVKITKCWAIEGLLPVPLDITRGFSPQDHLFVNALRYRAFPRQLTHFDFLGSRCSMETVPVSSGRASEYRCVVHEGPGVVTWTARRFFQPLSHEAIARNYMLRERDKRRAEEEERLKKAEIDQQATWRTILGSLSLVLDVGLLGLGQPDLD